MTDLTDEAVKALLDDDHIKFFADRLLEVARIKAATEPYEGECDQEDLASYAGEVVKLRRALLDARAELAATQTQLGDWIVRADEANVKVETLDAELATLRAQVERLTGALTIAANRLHRCSVDYDTGTREFIEVGEWADEARAAIRALAPADGLAAVKALRVEARENAMQALASMGQAQEAYEAQLEAEAELAVAQQREAALSDPICVHVNMLRGTIAKPTLEQIIHLYGVDALCKALMPVIVREAEAAIIRKGGTL